MTELHRFIWKHREDAPVRLALSAKKHPDLPIAYIARQVDALSKVRRKIPSWYQEGMVFPGTLSLEQASSEATARYKAALLSGQRMADLTGGLGVDAAFFSQQFTQVSFVEKNSEILEAAQHNFGVLGLDNVTFYNAAAEDFLSATDQNFDLIYLDPARRDDRKGKVFQLADCSPNILEIKDLLLLRASKVLVKTAPMLDINLAVRQLKKVTCVWVVAYENDCREVLYLLEPTAPAPTVVPIHAISLDKLGAPASSFEFTMEAEQQATSTYAPAAGFLYEPHPEILKSGAFKTFGQRFGFNKLHPNTHLYSSDQLNADVPARSFKIEAVCKYDKKALSMVLPEGQANVSTRNFPDSPDQVRKKLGLRDGGGRYVFAATDCTEKKLVLVCSKA